jgi:hypothetical protein
MRHFYVLFFLLLPVITVAQQLPLAQQAMNDFNILIQSADTTLYTGYRSSDWLEFRYILNDKRQAAGDSCLVSTTTKEEVSDKEFLQTTGCVMKVKTFCLQPIPTWMQQQERVIRKTVSYGMALQA